MMARRLLFTDEALTEVDDAGESSESVFLISEQKEMEWESDEEKTRLETQLESSDESDYEEDDDTWRIGDSDPPKPPFTIQNPGVHFPQRPDREIDTFQSFLTDNFLHGFVTATNVFDRVTSVHSIQMFSHNEDFYKFTGCCT